MVILSLFRALTRSASKTSLPLYFTSNYFFGVSLKMAQKLVDDAVSSHPVVVFSKTYCPYCTMAKKALADAGLKEYKLFELDERGDMASIQDYLLKLTGARSVPRVFIEGRSVGGGTDVRDLQANKKLVGMLKEAGAL